MDFQSAHPGQEQHHVLPLLRPGWCVRDIAGSVDLSHPVQDQPGICATPDPAVPLDPTYCVENSTDLSRSPQHLQVIGPEAAGHLWKSSVIIFDAGRRHFCSIESVMSNTVLNLHLPGSMALWWVARGQTPP